MLSEEKQKYANVFIHDVKLGNIVVDENKTFLEYIENYIKAAKDGQIHKFAETFGLDENQLHEIMKLHISEEKINEFGRLDNLKATADNQKIKEFFEKETGETLSIFKAKSKFDNLLRRFILEKGFDL